MEATSFIALSRQSALQREMSTIANNIANVNTAGFKGSACCSPNIWKSPASARSCPT